MSWYRSQPPKPRCAWPAVAASDEALGLERVGGLPHGVPAGADFRGADGLEVIERLWLVGEFAEDERAGTVALGRLPLLVGGGAEEVVDRLVRDAGFDGPRHRLSQAVF